MMKKYILSIWVFVLLLTAGCKKDELMTFDTADSIYFGNMATGAIYDSIGVTFFFAGENIKDSVLRIKLNCTGAPKNYDRYVTLVAGDSSTAQSGEHYAPLPDRFLFRAGRISDTIQIKLLRSASLKNGSFLLDLQLKPNEHFATNLWHRTYSLTGKLLNYTRLRLSTTDVFAQPPGWDVSYFGAFSLKKINVLTSVLDITIADFATMALADKQFYATFVKRYLIDMDRNGNTVYEEDGSMMSMGNLA